MSPDRTPLKPNDFPVQVDDKTIKKHDGEPIAKSEDAVTATDVAERLNENEDRREEEISGLLNVFSVERRLHWGIRTAARHGSVGPSVRAARGRYDGSISVHHPNIDPREYSRAHSA
jgi:hypothetical protein